MASLSTMIAADPAFWLNSQMDASIEPDVMADYIRCFQRPGDDRGLVRGLPRRGQPALSTDYRPTSQLGQAWPEAASPGVTVMSWMNWPISPIASIASGRNVQKMWKACVGTG